MVRFSEDSFTITIPTGGNPVEEWLNLHDDLCRLLMMQGEETCVVHWNTHRLLEELTPEWSVARKMTL
jgi:hypothetical protein